jgi:hypothetical protein
MTIIFWVKGAMWRVPKRNTRYETTATPISLENIYPLSKNIEKIRRVIGRKQIPKINNNTHQ